MPVQMASKATESAAGAVSSSIFQSHRLPHISVGHQAAYFEAFISVLSSHPPPLCSLKAAKPLSGHVAACGIALCWQVETLEQHEKYKQDPLHPSAACNAVVVDMSAGLGRLGCWQQGLLGQGQP